MAMTTNKSQMLYSQLSRLELAIAKLGTLVAQKEISLMDHNTQLQQHIAALEQAIVSFSRGEFDATCGLESTGGTCGTEQPAEG